MKALSIRQPWAWLIASGIKDVENRTWWTPIRGRIYIQAGKKLDVEGYNALVYYPSPLGIRRPELAHANDEGLLRLGAIIGEVDITDCRFRAPSPIDYGFSLWHEKGSWGFILANPVMYDYPIPCRGQLGFFEVKMPEVDTEYSTLFRDG